MAVLFRLRARRLKHRFAAIGHRRRRCRSDAIDFVYAVPIKVRVASPGVFYDVVRVVPWLVSQAAA